MCVPNIVEYISDYEFGVSCNNTGKFHYKRIEEIKDFSQNLIKMLKVELNEKFQLVSFSKKKVKAMIFGKFHTIEIDYNSSDGEYSWIVTVGTDDDEY